MLAYDIPVISNEPGHKSDLILYEQKQFEWTKGY